MKRLAIILSTILTGLLIGYGLQQARAASCHVVSKRVHATRFVRVHRHGRVVRHRRRYWKLSRRTVCVPSSAAATSSAPVPAAPLTALPSVSTAPSPDPQPTIGFVSLQQNVFAPSRVRITVLAGPFDPVPPAGTVRIVRLDRDPSFGVDGTICRLPVNLFVGFERSCEVDLVQMGCGSGLLGLSCQPHELEAVYEPPGVAAKTRLTLERVKLATQVKVFPSEERIKEATQDTTKGRVTWEAETKSADGTVLEPLPSTDPVSVGEKELVEHRPFGGYEWTLKVGEQELGRCPPEWWCGVHLLKVDEPGKDTAPWELEIEGIPEPKMLPMTRQEAAEGKLTATVHWEAALGGPGGGKFYYDSPTVTMPVVF